MIITPGAPDAQSLSEWLEQAGYASRPQLADGSMGAADTLLVAGAGTAIVRGALVVVREWVAAHRKTVTVELQGRGRFRVEGTDDVDRLLEALARPEGEGADRG